MIDTSEKSMGTGAVALEFTFGTISAVEVVFRMKSVRYEYEIQSYYMPVAYKTGTDEYTFILDFKTEDDFTRVLMGLCRGATSARKANCKIVIPAIDGPDYRYEGLVYTRYLSPMHIELKIVKEFTITRLDKEPSTMTDSELEQNARVWVDQNWGAWGVDPRRSHLERAYAAGAEYMKQKMTPPEPEPVNPDDELLDLLDKNLAPNLKALRGKENLQEFVNALRNVGVKIEVDEDFDPDSDADDDDDYEPWSGYDLF